MTGVQTCALPISVQVINTPPVAGADTIERYASQGVKVRLSTLLANDSDADGDTLTVTVATNSANGGTITVAGRRYNNVMPKFDFLSDQQIADLLSYVRHNFGNGADSVKAAEVRRIRTSR